MANLLVLPRPAKSMQDGAGFSKKLEHSRHAEKVTVASVPQRAVGKYARAVLAKSKKEQSRLSKAPDREMGEVKVSESRILGRKKGKSEWSMTRKEWTPQ